MRTKTEHKTIVMSYDNFESAIVSFLYATKTIPEGWDVIMSDFGIPLNQDGNIEFDIEIVKAVKPFRVVDKDYNNKDQLTLPFDHFERIEVVTNS